VRSTKGERASYAPLRPANGRKKAGIAPAFS